MPVDEHRESWKPGEPWEGALDEIAYIKELARELGGPERIVLFETARRKFF